MLDELIPFNEMDEDFVIVNSASDELADSDDLRPEFADSIIEMVINNISFDDVKIINN